MSWAYCCFQEALPLIPDLSAACLITVFSLINVFGKCLAVLYLFSKVQQKEWLPSECVGQNQFCHGNKDSGLDVVKTVQQQLSYKLYTLWVSSFLAVRTWCGNILWIKIIVSSFICRPGVLNGLSFVSPTCGMVSYSNIVQYWRKSCIILLLCDYVIVTRMVSSWSTDWWSVSGRPVCPMESKTR